MSFDFFYPHLFTALYDAYLTHFDILSLPRAFFVHFHSQERSHQYYMMLNNFYNKKMNLTDDPTAWIGWEILCQTAEALTMLIILRRNCTQPGFETVQAFSFRRLVNYSCDRWISTVVTSYLDTSPFMDLSQEIAVVFRISSQAMYDNQVSLEDVVHECRLAADTLSPSTTIHPWYGNVKKMSAAFECDGH